MLKPGLERSGGPGNGQPNEHTGLQGRHTQSVETQTYTQTTLGARGWANVTPLQGLKAIGGSIPGPTLASLAPARAVTFGAFSHPDEVGANADNPANYDNEMTRNV
jgi:hypothetical protein